MIVEISKINISLRMLKQLTEIDEFKGNWNAGVITKSNYFRQMKKISTIESIGSSNRVEENRLSNLRSKSELNLEK